MFNKIESLKKKTSKVNLKLSIKSNNFHDNTSDNNNNIKFESLSLTNSHSKFNRYEKFNIILIAKYEFESCKKNEINCKVGEAFKLIDKLEKGWLLVKSIGQISKIGLIPSSFVKIVNFMNHNYNINEDWLLSTNCKDDDHLISQKLSSPTSLITVNETNESFESSTSTNELFEMDSDPLNSPSSDLSTASSFDSLVAGGTDFFPLSGSTVNVSSFEGRYWYRVDILMSNNKKRYLCRYYQDFYKLHCLIVDQLRDTDPSLVSKLPSLPDPIPRPDLSTMSSMLLQRCKSLNNYINLIILNKYKLPYLAILKQWITPRHGDFEVDLFKAPNISNEIIELNLKPSSSLTSNKPSKASIPTKEVPASPNEALVPFQIHLTPPLPPPDHSRIQSLPVTKSSDMVAKSKYSRSHSLPDSESQFFSTPSTSSTTTPVVSEFIKINVSFNDDTFAIKFKRQESLEYLRSLISRRLNCNDTSMKLYLKKANHDMFLPLTNDTELKRSMQNNHKILIRVHLW